MGEPVAVVVARDRYGAEDALERIEVEYRELDPVVDPVAAAAPGAPLLHRDVGSNVVSDRRFRYGDPDAAFASAAHLAAMKLRERLARIASTGLNATPEALVFAGDGSFLCGTFADYLVPTACEVPAPTILHMESPSPFTPLGAKGVGEGNTMSTPVCLANAVADALELRRCGAADDAVESRVVARGRGAAATIWRLWCGCDHRSRGGAGRSWIHHSLHARGRR